MLIPIPIPIPIPQYGIDIVTSLDMHFWNFLVCFLSKRAKSIGIGRILQNPLESYVFRLQASRRSCSVGFRHYPIGSYRFPDFPIGFLSEQDFRIV